jgi:hypothetical protein
MDHVWGNSLKVLIFHFYLGGTQGIDIFRQRPKKIRAPGKKTVWRHAQLQPHLLPGARFFGAILRRIVRAGKGSGSSHTLG